MPIDQVKKDESKPKATVQQKTLKESFFFYKSDSLDLIQPNWSETLTNRELEENVDAIASFFDSVL
jgi:hypothetical protein